MPPVLERLIAGGLQNQLNLSSTPGVDLRGSPVGMLSGRFDGGEVVLPVQDFATEVRPEEISVELAPFDVDVLASVTRGRLTTEGRVSGKIRAVLSEEEVGRLARQGVYGGSFPVFGVDVEEGAISVQSEATAFGLTIPVSVEGDVAVQNGDVVFRPNRVEASGVELPQRLSGRLLQGTNYYYPVEGLPPEAVLNDAEAEKDRLVLTGDYGGLAM